MDTTSSPSSAFPYQQQQSQEAVPSPGGSSSSTSGSIGPFFAVISVLTFLAILSCFIGRICKNRSVTPLQSIKHSGFLGWLRRKCCLCATSDAQILANKGMSGQTESDDGKAVAQDAV